MLMVDYSATNGILKKMYNEYKLKPIRVCKYCKDVYAPMKSKTVCLACHDAKQERGTLPETVDWCRTKTNVPYYDLDAAASDELHVCECYMTKKDDGLSKTWFGHTWVNPPYDNIAAWVKKAWAEHYAGNTQTISTLIPANRTEQSWWQYHVENFRDKGVSHFRTFFLPGRTKFKGYKGSPPFSCVLLFWDKR